MCWMILMALDHRRTLPGCCSTFWTATRPNVSQLVPELLQGCWCHRGKHEAESQRSHGRKGCWFEPFTMLHFLFFYCYTTQSHAERRFFPQVFFFGQAKRDAHHASISERVDYIEKQLGDSADQHSLSPRHMGGPPKIGPPKSSILIGFSIIFTIHFGGFTTPIFGNTHIQIIPDTWWDVKPLHHKHNIFSNCSPFQYHPLVQVTFDPMRSRLKSRPCEAGPIARSPCKLWGGRKRGSNQNI